jgi:hypothetical protein
MSRIGKSRLRRLRNDIPIAELIQELELPSKEREGYFRFLCPLCNEFHTATNPKTNLARCFRCRRNFNPIDLVIVVRQCSFLDAVKWLDALSGADRQNPAVSDRR